MSLIGSTWVPIFCKRPVINSKGIKKNSNRTGMTIVVLIKTDVGVICIQSKQPDVQFANSSLASFVSNLTDILLVYLLNE